MVIELNIHVSESGSNNVARIQGEGISASSTNTARSAVEAAVKKYIARRELRDPRIDIYEGASNSPTRSKWNATITIESDLKL